MSVYELTGLSPVELQAMRLDGEVYRLADAYVPIALPEVAEIRAAAVLGERSPRLIAARETAAWIWGATVARPAADEFVVDIDARWRPRAHERIGVIEAVIEPGDVALLNGLKVTSRVRTVIDLCRFSPQFARREVDMVRVLADAGGFTAGECAELVHSRPRLAGKRRTLERLDQCQPELTR